MSRTSSGSSDSESGVNPTRSQKRAVSRRRSSLDGTGGPHGCLLPASGDAAGVAAAVTDHGAGGLTVPPGELSVSLPAVLGLRGAAHSPQNLWLAVTGLPQARQTRGRGLAHSPQNFCPPGLAVPHAGHAAVTCSIVPSSSHLHPPWWPLPRLGPAHSRHHCSAETLGPACTSTPRGHTSDWCAEDGCSRYLLAAVAG